MSLGEPSLAGIARLLAILAGCFFVGAVNPAALVARALGKDVRGSGSKNPGATNAGRVLGVRWGVVVLLLDVAKGFLPTVLLVRHVGPWVALAGSLFVVLGHMFSPYLRGRGGKGVATTLGALLALEPWVALGALVVFGIAYAVLRYVGLASAAVALGLVLTGVLAAFGAVTSIPRAMGWWLAIVGTIVLVRHRDNLRAWRRARSIADAG